MNVSEIDWKGGKVVSSHSFADLNVNRALSSQLDLLQEDLFQVTYGKGITLDLGWYPAFKAHGRFRLVIIKAQDWGKPIFEKEFNALDDLPENINVAISICVAASRQSAAKPW